MSRHLKIIISFTLKPDCNDCSFSIMRLLTAECAMIRAIHNLVSDIGKHLFEAILCSCHFLISCQGVTLTGCFVPLRGKLHMHYLQWTALDTLYY